jgi:hypothetical protein
MKILAAALALATSVAFATPALACGDRYGGAPTTTIETTPDVKLTAAKKTKKGKKAKKSKTAAKTVAKKAERATGQWPSLVERDGKLFLELHYPRFEQSGAHLYMDTFEIANDEQAESLRSHLEWEGKSSTQVTVQQTKSGSWKVVSFAEA